ncbi:OmpA family protein [Alcaligenaceae bacterium]|nr:OmpA family protein [Alcaligenaceae bacterium]
MSQLVARQRELEAELAAARKATHPGRPNRKQWHSPQAPTQEDEGWFTTYLDVMTLLLVLLVVMLAYSGKQMAASSTSPPSALASIALIPGLPSLDLPSISTSIGLLPGGNGLLPKVGLHHQHRALQGATSAASESYPEVAPTQLGQDFTSSEPSSNDTALNEEIALSISNTFAKGEPLVENGSLTGNNVLTQPEEAPVAPEQAPVAAVMPVEPDHSPQPNTPPKEDMLAGLPISELGDDIDIIVNERSISFRINSEILFGSGQAELSREGLAVLRRLIPVFSGVKHRITVEGHTDSVPMLRNRQYPSNWELSGARASSVVRYLQTNGITGDRLRAIGNADTQPLASNASPEGRANNRRVELIMERPEN